MSRGLRGRLDRLERSETHPEAKRSLGDLWLKFARGTATEEELAWFKTTYPHAFAPPPPDPLEEALRSLSGRQPSTDAPTSGADTDPSWSDS